MVWSRGRSAAALAVGALSALSKAQGLFGGDQSLSCSPALDFVDIGCFQGDQTGYTRFNPTSYDPTNPSSYSFPGFDPGSIINNTVTPQRCANLCRGYGFRTASLYAGTCACGYGIPDTFPPVTPGTCNTPCPGDGSQMCGGAEDTTLLVDPSFADLSNASPADIATHYQYLGCFHQEAGFPTDTVVTSTEVDVDGCMANCALLRYPLARAVPNG